MELQLIKTLQISDGAPTPALYSNEDDLHVLLKINGSEDLHLLFQDVLIYRFGSPNNEALQGHPYYNHGFRKNNIYQIIGSDWLNEIKQINSIHPRYNEKLFEDYKHYALNMHDHTLECISESIKISIDTDGREKLLNCF